MGWYCWLPVKNLGKSVQGRNLPYPFLRRQPLKFLPLIMWDSACLILGHFAREIGARKPKFNALVHALRYNAVLIRPAPLNSGKVLPHGLLFVFFITIRRHWQVGKKKN